MQTFGAVEGEVWFDRDKDGIRDAGEAPLPGVELEMTEDASGTGSLRIAQASQVAPRVWRTVTRADGTYRFDNVPPGKYRITAVAKAAGLDYTVDPDALADWVSTVAVPGGKTVEADFAAAGEGSMGGQVFLENTGQGIRNAAVTCRWAGIDNVLGNADDVLFDTRADAEGRFDLQGVPFGGFSCLGKDPSTGKLSARSDVKVASLVKVQAKLPVALAAPQRPAVPVRPPVQARPAPQLVRTGSDTDDLVELAALLLLAGLVLQVGGRRRRTS